MNIFSPYTPVKTTRMAVSRVYTILWSTGMVFVILPHLNLGLLSDYKICGDSECESLMSRVQAIRDHRGKDCRFLSFRQGDTIFVYHKLSGKREDLWAGSIDKQFGYFPKDAVQEEQVYAAVEKVVETQKSDFFCMDEFGYPIDSSHLDSDDDDDPKIQNQESEITQTTPHTVATNAESPSTSEDPSTESPVPAQDVDGTSTEEAENKNARDAAVGTHEEARETPAALNEQGGSAPSSWLGSSVTGWLGLAKEEEAGNLAEGEKKDERKEMQAEASVASSVTGWLGFGGEGKPEEEEDRGTADSFTSTMTGWLGFGGEKKTDHPAKEEQTEEREDDEEPAETFRSRRMSLDLEGSQLHEEEKKEMGTLGWLGNGLSSTLGFGLTNQESGHETTPEIETKETIQEEEEQPASGSWLDIGFRDILGFGKDKSEVDESTGSDFKETEEDKTSEQPTGSENVNTSQLQPVLTEEVRKETTNESKVGETPKDQNAPSEMRERVNADSNHNDIGTSDSSKDSVLPTDAASKVDEKDIAPQTMERMEGKDHQMPKSIAIEGEDNNREPGEEESKTASGTDQDLLTQSDINLGPDLSFVDLNLNSTGQSVGEDEKNNTEDVVGEGPEIPDQFDNTEESTDTSVTGAGRDGHEGEGNNAETDVLHREVSTTPTDDSAEESRVSGGAGESSGKSQPSFLSPGTAEERNEPTSDEDNTLPAHSVETDVDHSDSLAMNDNNTERETHQGELGEEGISQEFGSAHSTNRSTETMYDNASEEDRRTFSTSESTRQMENNADQDSVSPDMQQGETQSDGDAHELKETVEETETDGENNLQPVQTETTEFQKYILNESGLKSAKGSETETETEEVEESKEEEKLGGIEELKEEEKQQEVKEIKEEGKQEVKEINEEGKQQEVKEIKEEGKQQEVKEIKEEGKQEVKEIKEEGKQEVKEIKEEGKQEVKEIKEEGKQAVKEIKEEGKQQEVKEIKEEGKQEVKETKEEGKQEVKEIKEEGKQEVKEIKEEGKQQEVKEIKEEGKQEVKETKEEGKQEVKETKEEGKQEVKEIKEEEKLGGIEELKKEEKQQDMKKIKEEGKQEEVKEIKEEGKQEEVKEIKEEGKQEVKETKEEGKQEVKEIKEEGKQQEVKEIKEEGKQEVKKIKEEGKQQEVKEIKEEGKQEVKEIKEEGKQEEVKEIKEEEKLGGIEELKKEEKQQDMKKIKEEGKQEEVKEIKEEGKQEEVKEIKEEGKQEVKETKEEGKQEVKEIKEEGKQQEVKEIKEEGKQEVKKIKEEGKQQEVKEIKEEGKQEVKEIKEEGKQEVKEIKEEEKLGGIEELKKEEKQQDVKKIKEEGKQEEVKEIKEEGKQEVKEIKEEGKQEVKEIKEEGKQEADKLKEKKKQEKVEEIKEEDNQEEEEGKQGEEEELNEEEKKVEIKEGKKQEELKEEEKQQEIGEFKEEEKREELKEVERVKEQEKKEGEEKQVQSNVEVLMENSMHSLSHTQKATESPESESNGEETRGENSSVFSEMSTKTHERQTENPHMDEEKREGENKKQEEVKEKQETGNLEGERRNIGKEGSHKCSNELCPQASGDKFVGVRDGNDSANKLSSIDEGTKETGKQNPVADNDQILADRTGVSQMVPVDDTERDEDVTQEEEEKKVDVAKADEGREEQVEQKNNDLLHSGESGQNSLPDQLSLSQTAENKEDDQLYPSEADNTELSDDNVLRQGDKTKSEDTETSSEGISTEKETEQIHSDYMIDTVEDTDREEREINVKHDDVRVNEGRGLSTGGTVLRTEEEMEISVSSSDPVESQAAISEQTAQHASGSSHLSDGHNKGAAETGSGGAFGLFKNAFSFFSQTPVAETTAPPESTPSLDPNTGETSEAQASLPPEQERDSTTDSSQVYMQDLHTDSPITLSQQQLQPLFTETQTSSPSLTPTRSHPTESPIQTKTLTKHYKNLLIYMSADETTIMMELFGRHKLQFLDYVLGSSETTTDDPDNDESILLDIERLLRYHRETLVAPSMRLTDAPQEDKEKTTTLIALQKLEMLLARVRETFNTAEASCVGESCSTHSKDKETATEEDPSVRLDNHTPRDERMGLDGETEGRLSGGAGKEKVTEDKTKEEKGKRSGGERVSPESHPHIQPGSPQSLEGVINQILDFVHQIADDATTHVCAVRELLIWLTEQVVSTLPDDIRPGPDLYGVPWEPVIITSVVGLVTMLLFTCRCYSSVKSRMYRGKERRMAEQVAQLLDEKCKVLETLSKCQQEYDDLEGSLRDSGVLAQTQKTEHLEVKARQLEHAKRELDRDLEQLKDQLDQQREHRIEQEKRIAVLEESMKTFEEETKDLQSQEEQAQTTLKVYNMNSDRLQRNLETAGEENTLLQESNAQLRQQVEGWAERVSELEAEMSRCEVAHRGMLQDVANKDERIMSLTDRLLSMKAWDSDLQEEADGEGEGQEASNGTAGRGEENGRGDVLDTQGHLQKVQKLIYAAKLNADLKSVDEDKDRLFAKLNDEVKAKEDLQVRIEELDNEKLSLQSDTEQYSDQVQKLQQKLQIMTEMYQENELKLHRLLTVEEKERMQKEEKLNKADKNITMAMEELSNYRQRAGEMEEELEKTKQSYQTQISAHEKKAHNNWLAARAAERELADIRRENGLFRQKLTDTQFKLDALDNDPYALDSLARPLPFRAERSPYGLSPLGRPASETRAFLSPPTLMDGPPARLSPRVSRGPVEPPGGQGEMERSGGPHSDSGSISPTWERDRRGPPPGPLGPPGYMFPEQGGPMYRRPPPGALGLLPPPGPLHPRGLPPLPPHPADMADGSYRENSHGPGEQEHRESGPGDRRTPPEMDPRMGGAPPPGPPMGPMGPMDGPFPRRSPYGPPPPDFYPPRGPVGPTMMPMWAPPPPGMMFPPRFPPGGPPHPHYAPPMRPPLPDGHLHTSMAPPPPQQSLPSPPHSQSPEQHTPSPEDAI
ncbi:uncharacterized protein ctage5 isoform X4 [Sander lucioperca]|uniref:uncharacterized protein ctage5 isoform X4 n=1 Tax=Sander lucioperca TaxID=283035 RepID=UPI001653D878|nr:uncharacterized protein ctage5 isoform X4 [Sander lucioperca]